MTAGQQDVVILAAARARGDNGFRRGEQRPSAARATAKCPAVDRIDVSPLTAQSGVTLACGGSLGCDALAVGGGAVRLRIGFRSGSARPSGRGCRGRSFLPGYGRHEWRTAGGTSSTAPCGLARRPATARQPLPGGPVVECLHSSARNGGEAVDGPLLV